jgi:hypothetical protein
MRYVGILVEGETEEQFVKVVLNPYFEPSQLLFDPVRVGKSGKKGRKDGRKKAGGISNFHEFQSDLNELLRNTVYIRVTTMFDYYRLPKDFPGYQTLTSAMKSHQAVEHLEEALRDAINHPRFLPYLSLWRNDLDLS